MNGRNYTVEVKYVSSNKILKANIRNAGGPVSALMLFLNENEVNQMDQIEAISIIDETNKSLINLNQNIGQMLQ